MAWTVQILTVTDTPVPSPAKDMQVLFTATGGREIRRGYKLSADNFSTPQSVVTFLAGEVSKLDQLDATASDLESYLGSEITAAGLP